jgi:SET domain-containing protein
MLLVKTEVKPSDLHGMGVFAAHDIVEGTAVWQYNPIIDRIIQKDEIRDLPEHILDHLKHRAYIDITGNYVISLDNNQYFNHSYEPNVKWNDNEHAFCASYDIAAGEELTKTYHDFYEYDISNMREA